MFLFFWGGGSHYFTHSWDPNRSVLTVSRTGCAALMQIGSQQKETLPRMRKQKFSCGSTQTAMRHHCVQSNTHIHIFLLAKHCFNKGSMLPYSPYLAPHDFYLLSLKG